MSDLVGNPEDRFSRVAAHIIYLILTSSVKWLARRHPFRFALVNVFRERLNIIFKLNIP